MALKELQKAPNFTADSDEGKISLSDYYGKSNVVLYFYPKDETLGCTKEACAFRDNFENISAKDAIVIGVSSDSVESHRKFKNHHSLPFTLGSDPDGSIAKLYGVRTKFLLPARVTFVIDKQGIIRSVVDSNIDMSKHAKDSLKALRELEDKPEQTST